MTDQTSRTGIVHLTERQPTVSGPEMLASLVPPPQFDGATFESYRADPAYPSQEEAKETLQRFAGRGGSPVKRGGLFSRAKKEPEMKPGVYLDGGFGVCRRAVVRPPDELGSPFGQRKPPGIQVESEVRRLVASLDGAGHGRALHDESVRQHELLVVVAALPRDRLGARGVGDVERTVAASERLAGVPCRFDLCCDFLAALAAAHTVPCFHFSAD